jgi:chromosome segregation ATPase
MLLAQASAVEPAWLHQAWIFAVIIAGLFAGPAVTLWVANRKQRREVVQGEEYVVKGTCGMLHAHSEQRFQELDQRVKRLESDVSTAIRELRNEISGQLAGMRQDIQLLVRAVGQLEGRVEQLEKRVEQVERRMGQLEGRLGQLENETHAFK